MKGFLSGLFSKGQSAQFVKNAEPVLEAALAVEPSLQQASQEELQQRLNALKERTGGNPATPEDVGEVFALVREAAKRTLNERHYDVQLIGGLALAQGKIAEMRTGEGKTLVATLAATLRALSGKGVHVVTVNDYLARRDGAWMGQVYAYLGLSVGVVTSSGAYIYDAAHTAPEEDSARDESGSFRVFYDYLRPATKREAYAASITYATNNELGFDYLRDNTAYEPSQISLRGQHFAIVDEIDSILIDEARTPLIISGPAEDAGPAYTRFAKLVSSFSEGEDYIVDEKHRQIQLTDNAIKKAEKALNVENLYTEGGMKLAFHLETAVKAKALYRKDKEYVIQNGQIVIIDEFTGRMQAGRRWSDGIHQAVEAKEGVAIQRENRTYASVTFQNLFRLYESLSGMTGTALSSSEEFYSVYELEVVSIPTNKEVRRVDKEDLIFQTNKGKYIALARRVKELHEKGQPVLIGTVSIENNEVVSRALNEAQVPHEVLNAKNHEREGELIAQAGKRGRVTVATNLAGRGVDIKLGGAPFQKEEYDAVVALGGLAVIGTERHEARRIDNQLRGRAGRQGDPGETQFFVSLEDDLMRVFAGDFVKRVMGSFKFPEDMPLTDKMLTNTLENAQKRVEGAHFDARKQVLAYDAVLNTQRIAIYAKRNIALLSSNQDFSALINEHFKEESAQTLLQRKKEEFGEERFLPIMRRFFLQVLDAHWLEHIDTMTDLRRVVALRAHGQRDPLIEYQREGLTRFRELEVRFHEALIHALSHLRIVDEGALKKEGERTRSAVLRASDAGSQSENREPIKNEHSFGRNDMVTVRKGEEVQTIKFKKAETLLKEGWSLEK